MKKFFAMLLSLVMILSLSVPAFAADTTLTGTAEGSNSASKNVTASYTPSSTEDTTATITGVSITVDGTTYTSGNVTITPNSTVSITVTGTNLKNGTMDNYVSYASGCGEPLSYSGFTISDDGTTATLSPPVSDFANSTNYEIYYYNNYNDTGNRTAVYTGIDVTYDSGIAEEDKAVITGVSITVDGTTYTSGTATITPDTQSITLTVTGTNLKNGTMDNYVRYASGCAVILSNSKFEFNETGTIATLSRPVSDFASSTNYEIVYYNNYTDTGNRTKVSTGIFVTYESGSTEDTTATITGVSITVDGNTYGYGQTATITPKTTSIIITVTGTNLNNGTMDNVVAYAPGSSIDVSTGQSWNFEDDGSGATIDISQSLIDFISATTAFELEYCNDFLTDETWTGSGVYVIYQSETVSVDITWGAMSFTYDDTVAEGATEETGWTCADGANKITVSNNGTVNVNAAVAYTPADGYSAITGEFQNVNEATVTNADIDASNSYDFYLILSGKPETALDGATIGSVTVTITKNTASE